jgi:hypothetical protein
MRKSFVVAVWPSSLLGVIMVPAAVVVVVVVVDMLTCRQGSRQRVSSPMSQLDSTRLAILGVVVVDMLTHRQGSRHVVPSPMSWLGTRLAIVW